MKVSILRKNGHEVVNLNRRKAIRGKCRNCSGWEYKAISNCEFIHCPIYFFRSGKGKQNSNKRAKAIRFYCLSCMNGQRREVALCPSLDCSLHPYRKSVVDRAAEITLTVKKQRIQLVSQPKNKKTYRIEVSNQKQENTSLAGAGIREKMSLLPPA